MAGELEGSQPLRQDDGLQEELRVVSHRLVKLETLGIAQELRLLSRLLARLEAGTLPGASETEMEQCQTRTTRKLKHKSVILAESDHLLQESFRDGLLLVALDEIRPARSALISLGVLASLGL